MSHIIDRRHDSSKKSTVNRTRFLKRFKDQIKKAVGKSFNSRSIEDFSDSGEEIKIPKKDLSEPSFGHGSGGVLDKVFPGNREYLPGDTVPRPQSGGHGIGSGAGQSGEGEDDFTFELSREEFMDLFFEDLELPNLIQKQLATTTEFKVVRAGFSSEGSPGNLSVVRSFRNSLARRIAMQSPRYRRIRDVEEELKTCEDEEKRKELLAEIASLRARALAVPFLDTFDLRYSNHVLQPQPTICAVVFFILDTSGSMLQTHKELAKRFFVLLYLFLQKNYEKIDVVFIRHHVEARECNEEEFFHARDTGGTIVSSALKLMHEIAIHRYPTTKWNLYVAQASDGDNWEHDSKECKDMLDTKIMPMIQYFAYIEILADNRQSLWNAYESVKKGHRNFDMAEVKEASEIYPVFRELFKRRH